MIDIHSHILPGLDDGSKSWDMTLAMCLLALQHGTTHIVATPHANDTYSRDQVRNLVHELDHRISGVGQLAFSIGCDWCNAEDVRWRLLCFRRRDEVSGPSRTRVSKGPNDGQLFSLLFLSAPTMVTAIGEPTTVQDHAADFR
jgi:capsular polysaccharide synthesis CpsB/CapC-like protein